MRKLLIAILLGSLTLGAGKACAFWRRSQVSMCADAVSDAERARHRCWELEPYIDSGWPVLGIGVGSLTRWRGIESYPAPIDPVSPRYRSGVTRRLG